jgi:hypothetical protein
MTGLMDREEKLLRLAVDAGATDGEAKAAGEKFITMLRSRQYNVDEADPRDQIIAELEQVARAQDEELRKAVEILKMADAEIAELKTQQAAPMAKTPWRYQFRIWHIVLAYFVLKIIAAIVGSGS